MLVKDKPEGLPTTDALADLEDPDAPQPAGERAEIYLSGAHVCTLEDAPKGLGRVTLMVELEVVEESIRFIENGDVEVPIRRCKRVGDMWIPGTQRPPTAEEIKAEQAAAKAQAAREQAEREEAERAEQEHNEPPMFDEDGNPINHDAPAEDDAEDQDDDVPPEPDSNVVQFSDSGKKPTK